MDTLSGPIVSNIWRLVHAHYLTQVHDQLLKVLVRITNKINSHNWDLCGQRYGYFFVYCKCKACATWSLCPLPVPDNPTEMIYINKLTTDSYLTYKFYCAQCFEYQNCGM